MAAKKNSAMDQLLAKAKADLEMAMNKGIADKLAEHDPQLFEQLSAQVAKELSEPKPKRTRATKKTEPATPDASTQPSEGEQSQQHEGDGHHGG